MSETTSYQGGQHSWYSPNQEPIVWSVGDWRNEGWTIEKDNGRYEVYYRTNEAMRLSADGVLSWGRKSYWFNTLEWAELCVKRLESLDRAFGRYASGITLDTSGNFGIGTSSPAYKFVVTGQNSEPLVSMDQGGRITHFNLPKLFMIWWRSTRVYAAWRVLMWGEREWD